MAEHRLLVFLCMFIISASAYVDEARRNEEYANDALSGVYSECFAQVSFTCLQRKVLQFLHRMSRMEKFDLFGNYLSVVKTRDDAEGDVDFQTRLARAERDNVLDQLMDNTIDRFFSTHVIRVQLPNTLAVVSGPAGRSTDSKFDLQFPESNDVEARKKGGGGGGGKMGKKMMMMMMMGLKAKLMMLGPMMMGLAGIMAMKALIAGVVSLTISKIMIIKKLMKQKQGGGGGGHSHGGWESSSSGGGGWSSGGGSSGGWDKRSDDFSQWEPSQLAYRAYTTLENLL